MKIFTRILPLKTSLFSGVPVFMLIVLLAASNAFAQTAPMRGKVQLTRADGTKRAVRGALVEVYRLDIGAKYPSDKTDANGEFSLAGLPLGANYKLCVSAPRIAPLCLANIKAGMENIIIDVVEGDGSRLTVEKNEEKTVVPDALPNESLPRFEIGVQFSALMRRKPSPLFNSPTIVPDDFERDNRYGGGARFTYNLTENIAVEAEGNFFPKKDDFRDLSVPGGNILQAQFGVKIGKRFKRVGVFGKARPGFVRFSEASEMTGTTNITVGGQQFPVGEFRVGKAAYFSADLGGVFEFYPSRRIVARFDVGDTIIRYGAYRRESLMLSRPFLERPAQTKHNLQFSAGIGFRF